MANTAFSTSNQSPDGGVPAIEKAARIIEVVVDSPAALGVSEIARRAHLSKSSVHGLVTALVEHGFLERSVTPVSYALGYRMHMWAARAGDRRVLEEARMIVSQLVRQTGQTVLFGRLRGDEVRVLARQTSGRAGAVTARLASVLPVTAGALGEAHRSLPSHAGNEGQNARTSSKPILNGEPQGPAYACEREEYIPGIAAAATALDWQGSTYFLWSICISSTVSDDQLSDIGQALVAARQSLLRSLEGASDGRTG